MQLVRVPSTLRLALLVAVVLAATALQPTAAGAETSVPTCFGQDVTVSLANGDRPTNGDDVILGTGGADFIKGRGGNDLICGLGGDDRILGGPGDDHIRGGAGDDFVSGGLGLDRIAGGGGNDTLTAGRRNGLLNGGRGVDDCAGSSRLANCEPNCVTGTSMSSRVLRGNFRIANEGTEACHFGTDGLQLLADVDVAPNVREVTAISHLDSSDIDAMNLPAPTGLKPGQTLVVTLVNLAFPCAEGTPETTWVQVLSGVKKPSIAFRQSTCGLGYTTWLKN